MLGEGRNYEVYFMLTSAMLRCFRSDQGEADTETKASLHVSALMGITCPFNGLM